MCAGEEGNNGEKCSKAREKKIDNWGRRSKAWGLESATGRGGTATGETQATTVGRLGRGPRKCVHVCVRRFSSLTTPQLIIHGTTGTICQNKHNYTRCL